MHPGKFSMVPIQYITIQLLIFREVGMYDILGPNFWGPKDAAREV